MPSFKIFNFSLALYTLYQFRGRALDENHTIILYKAFSSGKFFFFFSKCSSLKMCTSVHNVFSPKRVFFPKCSSLKRFSPQSVLHSKNVLLRVFSPSKSVLLKVFSSNCSPLWMCSPWSVLSSKCVSSKVFTSCFILGWTREPPVGSPAVSIGTTA